MRASLALLATVVAAAAAVAAPASGSRVEKGHDLYENACATCHGGRGEGITSLGRPHSANGVRGMGPPLIGVGAQAADFYLRTGYMPLRDAASQPRRSRPRFSDAEIRALVAYVASLGPGPPIPKPQPERGNLSRGMELFTQNCAGCHQVAAQGGVVTGAVAPDLKDATPTQIAQAVRIGPYLMPSFSAKQLGPRELDSIVRYVEYVKHPADPGGWAIGHLGPFPEGILTWFVAAVALVAVTMLIGVKLR
jgi:ubiquinol-cytochrome c reductase cytochrome c subunit